MIADLKIRDIQEYIMDKKMETFTGIRLISVYTKKEPSGFDIVKVVSVCASNNRLGHILVHPKTPEFKTITSEDVFDVIMQILEQLKNNQQDLNFYRLRLDEPNEDQFEYQVKIDPPISGVQVQELRIEDLQ